MSTHDRETDPFVLLRTKLQRQRLRPSLVLRPRLLDQLHACLRQSDGLGTLGFARKLILVSAPIGYGKTTLASSWLETCDCPSTWLSLDEEDDDLALFLTCRLAAIETVFPGGADETLALLRAAARLPLPFLAPP